MMYIKSDLTADQVREMLSYDKETGEMRWRIKRSNFVPAGGIAGHIHHSGYWILKIDGKQYAQHRLAWLMETGEWPPEFIDHINRIRSDNRWCNLRLATCSQNMMNTVKKSGKSTEFKNVSARKDGLFQAQVVANGDRHQKAFLELPDAVEWVSGKRSEIHGAYANE